MFPGGSEIIISVIVKHVQHVGIIRVFCLPGVTYYNFQYLGDRKIAGLWFTRPPPLVKPFSQFSLATNKNYQRPHKLITRTIIYIVSYIKNTFQELFCP